MPPTSASQKPLALALLGVAVAISSWMAWVAWRSGALAGCGEGCSTVLSSHWAYLGPIPVSLLGAVIYLDTLIAVFRKKAGPTRILAAIILAGALYFFVIQAFVLRAFCPWCCATHLIASSTADLAIRLSPLPERTPTARYALPAACAALSVALLAVAQIVAPHQPGSIAVTATGQTYLTPTANGDWLAYGKLAINPSDFPQLTSTATNPSLPPVLLLHDWTCGHCRELHRTLAESPTPIPNPVVLIPASRDPDGLQIHRRMTAAFLADPALYHTAAETILAAAQHPTPQSVNALLASLAPTPEQDARASRLLDLGLAVLSENDARLTVSTLPQLLSPHTLITGAPSPEVLQDFLAQARLPLTPATPAATPAATPTAPELASAAAASPTPAPGLPSTANVAATPSPQPATQTSQSKIQFEETTVHLPPVRPGEISKATFRFSNTGTDTLQITGVQAGCGCTAVSGWPNQLAPGEHGELSVAFNSNNFVPGTHTRGISVRSNASNADPGTQMSSLFMVATVIAPDATTQPYRVSEPTIAFGHVTAGQAPPERTSLITLQDHTLLPQLDAIRVPAPLRATLVAAAQPHTYLLSVALPQPTPGPLNLTIEIPFTRSTAPAASTTTPVSTATTPPTPQASATAPPLLTIPVHAFVVPGQSLHLSHQEILPPRGPLAQPYDFEAFLTLIDMPGVKPTATWQLPADHPPATPWPQPALIELEPGRFRIHLTFPAGWAFPPASSDSPAPALLFKASAHAATLKLRTLSNS